VIIKYLDFIQEFDYVKIHGHEKCKINSVLWYFHNYEHGYKHCKGGLKNPYKIEHFKGKHIIDKEFARGHGIKRSPSWFKFTKKIKPGWWEVESGVKINLNQVPESLK
jgi:hypothetical protein